MYDSNDKIYKNKSPTQTENSRSFPSILFELLLAAFKRNLSTGFVPNEDKIDYYIAYIIFLKLYVY